jgi:tetratricopeptide (TPR) repeat protein
MIWEYSDSYAYKGDLAIMDLLSNNNWKRPIYISTTVPADQYKGLEKYFIQEGMAYRVAPVKTDSAEQGEYGSIDPDTMYDNMMNKFKWGNAADPHVYLDENNRRMFVNFRRLFGNLGNALLQAGDTVRAVEAVRKGIEVVPAEKLPHDYFSIVLAEDLIKAGHTEEGMRLLDNIIGYADQYLSYVIRLRNTQRFGLDYSTGINMQALLDIYNMSVKMKMGSLTKSVEPLVNKYYTQLYSRK